MPHLAQGGAFLENRRGAGNLARSRLSGGSWARSEPSWPAEGRLKAGCSQDWLPHKAAHIFIIRCDAPGRHEPLMPQFRLIFTFCSPTMVARSFDGTDQAAEAGTGFHRQFCGRQWLLAKLWGVRI